jgi:hypothetical protein
MCVCARVGCAIKDELTLNFIGKLNNNDNANNNSISGSSSSSSSSSSISSISSISSSSSSGSSSSSSSRVVVVVTVVIIVVAIISIIMMIIDILSIIIKNRSNEAGIIKGPIYRERKLRAEYILREREREREREYTYYIETDYRQNNGASLSACSIECKISCSYRNIR